MHFWCSSRDADGAAWFAGSHHEGNGLRSLLGDKGSNSAFQVAFKWSRSSLSICSNSDAWVWGRHCDLRQQTLQNNSQRKQKAAPKKKGNIFFCSWRKLFWRASPWTRRWNQLLMLRCIISGWQTKKRGQPRFSEWADGTKIKVQMFAWEGWKASCGPEERREVVSGAGLNSNHNNKVRGVIPGHWNVTVLLLRRDSPHTAAANRSHAN